MLHNPIDNRSLYNAYDWMMQMLQPYSNYCATLAKRYRRVSDTMNVSVKLPFLPDYSNEAYQSYLDDLACVYREWAGCLYVSHMFTNVFEKPAFNITDVQIDEIYYDVIEELVDRKSFCKLLHFKKMKFKDSLPKMLVVAPMSGHYSTLLRDTVAKLLPFYDVYITDWMNARDVPLTEGSFDLDDFVEYLISYFHSLAPDLNVMAVCQPTVPVLIALAILSKRKDEQMPKTAILLGGPIDTRQAPTAVNVFATSRGDDWFQQNVISLVPNRFPGAMRLVYPGFMQLAGFMSMNIQRHLESLQNAITNYSFNRKEAAFKIIRFYLEYFSTMDLTAEFYMQTINTVFQEKLLTQGKYKSGGYNIRLQDIRNTAILAIEGERDDITGLGQTKAALEFCTGIPDEKKEYYLAEKVGHYGLFNGSKFRKLIVPEMLRFTEKNKG